MHTAAADTLDRIVRYLPLYQALAELPDERARLLIEREYGLYGRHPEPVTRIAEGLGVSVGGAIKLRRDAFVRLRHRLQPHRSSWLDD